MRHLLSHRNFEEAAYYKYCMKRPCLSDPYYAAAVQLHPA